MTESECSLFPPRIHIVKGAGRDGRVRASVLARQVGLERGQGVRVPLYIVALGIDVPLFFYKL